MNTPTDVLSRYLAGGQWRSNTNLRSPSSEGGEKRNAKRARLGNAKMRKLYIHPHAPKFGEYSALCGKADGLNGKRAYVDIPGKNIARGAGL
jgi:hypothetical protein